MKRLSLLGIIVLGLAFTVCSAFAASDSTTLTVSTTLISRAKLTITTGNSVSFADTDPDTPGDITGTPTSTVEAKFRAGSSATTNLAVAAAEFSPTGGPSIATGNVKWTSTGDYSASGTLNTTSQNVGSWTGGGSKSGTFTWLLSGNSWTWAAAAYSSVVTLTLSNP